MSHGRTDEVARRPVAGNSAAAGANSDLPLTGHSTNGHGDRSPPASGVKNGHTHTHMAPDEDAHTHTQTMDIAVTVQPSNLIIKPHQETRLSYKDNCDDLSRLLLQDQRKPQY
jgi:hypothetical protein